MDNESEPDPPLVIWGSQEGHNLYTLTISSLYQKHNRYLLKELDRWHRPRRNLKREPRTKTAVRETLEKTLRSPRYELEVFHMHTQMFPKS